MKVSVQYVKVAEFQRRGLLHFHLAIRLDSAALVEDDHAEPVHAFAPPPGGYTAELLGEAIRAAVARVQAPYPARAQRPIPGTEPINIDMVQQRGEPRGPVLCGNVPHTLQRT